MDRAPVRRLRWAPTRAARWAFLALLSLIAALVAPGVTGAARAGEGTLVSWVQLGPDGRVSARAITRAPGCPAVEVDGRALAMAVRAAPSPPAVPVLTCEAALPAGARAASIDGRPLPLPRPDPRRILVIGDTGCRVKGSAIQNCNDPAAWPFARLAAVAAEWRPDLVIHVGDYWYRESPCPAGNAGCAGPTGYNWPMWDADFFTPAAPLLRAAPWVFVRGNHEDCERSGPAWFRFLDARPVPASCQEMTEPYSIPLGGLQLLLLDSAEAADDETAVPAQTTDYSAQFAALRALAGPNAWLLTHAPVWGFGHLGVENGVEQLFRDDAELQAASGNVLPAGVRLVLSGHIHLFEYLSFDQPRPPQLIVGNSGTLLDPPVTTPLPGLEIGGATVKEGATIDRFGFMTIEPSGDGYDATLRDVNGAPMLTCTVARETIACARDE